MHINGISLNTTSVWDILIGLGSANTLYGSPDCMVWGDGGQVCTLAAREAIQSFDGDFPGNGLYVTPVDGNHDVVQLMAMAITSGFTQCNRHSSLPSLIPSVLICQTFFVIALYDPKRDYFLQTIELQFAEISQDEQITLHKELLFLLLWMVFHYRYNICNTRTYHRASLIEPHSML